MDAGARRALRRSAGAGLATLLLISGLVAGCAFLVAKQDAIDRHVKETGGQVEVSVDPARPGDALGDESNDSSPLIAGLVVGAIMIIGCLILLPLHLFRLLLLRTRLRRSAWTHYPATVNTYRSGVASHHVVMLRTADGVRSFTLKDTLQPRIAPSRLRDATTLEVATLTRGDVAVRSAPGTPLRVAKSQSRVLTPATYAAR